MRLLLALVVAAAAGATAAVLLSGGGDERTATTTVTRTAPATTPVIPAAVERTRAAIQRAADAHDVEALRELTPDDLRYTFGENEAGGAVDHWLELEQRGDDPLGILARVLEMPYTVVAGNYFFPFAYDKEPAELGPYGRRVLGDLVDDYVGESYYGWRAGISADGRWTVYVAGD